MDDMFELDAFLSQKCAIAASNQTHVYLRFAMKLLEWSVHGIPWVFGSFGVVLYATSDKYIQLGTNLFIALLIDLIVNAFIKAVFRRPRPAYNFDDMHLQAPIFDRYSFPSGHAARGAMLACLFLGVNEKTFFNDFVGHIFPLLLAASRVMLGRHYISDVVAGLIIGYVEGSVLLPLWMPPNEARFIAIPIKTFFSFHERKN